MKKCPQCGSITFDDMEVCYGCLHRFDGTEQQVVAVSEESTVLNAVTYPLPDELAALPTGAVVAQCSTGREPVPRPASLRERVANLADLSALADFPQFELDLAEPLPSPRNGGICLCVDEGGRVMRHRIDEEHALVVGRSASCDIQLTDPMVSRRHMRVGMRQGQLLLEDLGSSNPTYVDGMPLEGRMAVALSACITIARAKLWTEQLSRGIGSGGGEGDESGREGPAPLPVSA